MAFATYRDLWLEANDPAGVAGFWARALQLALEALPHGAYRLSGPRPEQTIYVSPSGPGTLAGFRIDVDVDESSVDSLRDLGASPVRSVDDDTNDGDTNDGDTNDGDTNDDETWLALTGPEDSELHYFPSSEPLTERWYELVMAATQPARAARWWARVLGAVHESAAGGDYAWVAQVPDAPFETVLFTDAGPAAARRRARMRLATSDMPGLIRYGAAMVAGQLPPVTGSAYDETRPTYVMCCADGVEFIVVDTSGSPETARSPRPAKPSMGPW